MMAQISATVKQITVDSIWAIAKSENRTFSNTVSMLLDEAVNGRVTKELDRRLKNTKKSK